MLIAVDNPASNRGITDTESHDLELRWLTTVGGKPAAHHTLRIEAPAAATASLLGAPLPRWSVTTAAWALLLQWSLRAHPRVLRSTDRFAERLGVTDTAAALVVREQGQGQEQICVEHELIVLAGFTAQALPSGWQPGAGPAWRDSSAAA